MYTVHTYMLNADTLVELGFIQILQWNLSIKLIAREGNISSIFNMKGIWALEKKYDKKKKRKRTNKRGKMMPG